MICTDLNGYHQYEQLSGEIHSLLILSPGWAEGNFRWGLLSNKVGHLYCRICGGIEVSNLLRILLSKVTNEVSNYEIKCG